MSLVRRFFQIGSSGEASAVEGGSVAAGEGVRARFESLPVGQAPPDAGGTGAPGETVPPSPTTAHRFGRGPGRIEVAVDDESEQPFVRCMTCHADNHRQASECQACRISLDTEAQRRYNAELRPRLQEEADQARRQAEHRRDDRERRFAEEVVERRQREAAREREDAETSGWRGFLSRTRGSLGQSLLRRIADPRIRLVILLAIMVLPFFVWRRSHGWAFFLSVVTILVFSLPSPSARGFRW